MRKNVKEEGREFKSALKAEGVKVLVCYVYLI